MMSSRSISVAVLALVTGLLSAAQADIVLGRGGNCTAVWDTFGAVTTSTRNRTNLTCEDGDASCDLDGEIDGVCTLQLNACIGQPTPDCPAPLRCMGLLRLRVSVLPVLPRRLRRLTEVAQPGEAAPAPVPMRNPSDHLTDTDAGEHPRQRLLAVACARLHPLYVVGFLTAARLGELRGLPARR